MNTQLMNLPSTAWSPLLNIFSPAREPGQDWMDAFIEYCKSDNRDRNKCEKCVSDCKKRFDNSIP